MAFKSCRSDHSNQPANIEENEGVSNSENDSTGDAPKDSPNISDGFGGEEEQNLKFPKRLRHNGRGKVLATIYKRPEHPQYRLYWRARVDGKARSRMKDFAAYSEAKRAGDKVVADVAKKESATPARNATPGVYVFCRSFF